MKAETEPPLKSPVIARVLFIPTDAILYMMPVDDWSQGYVKNDRPEFSSTHVYSEKKCVLLYCGGQVHLKRGEPREPQIVKTPVKYMKLPGHIRRYSV